LLSYRTSSSKRRAKMLLPRDQSRNLLEMSELRVELRERRRQPQNLLLRPRKPQERNPLNLPVKSKRLQRRSLNIPPPNRLERRNHPLRARFLPESLLLKAPRSSQLTHHQVARNQQKPLTK
jgi:hypothetical protein